jgi:hypothetical protein
MTTTSKKSSVRVKLVGGSLGKSLAKERPVALEPFLSRDQWKAFADEVNQVNRSNRQTVAGRFALAFPYLVLCGFPPMFFLLVAGPYISDELAHMILIVAGFGGLGGVPVLSFPTMLVAAHFLQKWWTTQLREVEQRTSAALLTSNISVHFMGECDAEGDTEHFFEFSYIGARDIEEEVDTFISSDNSIHDGNKTTIIVPTVDEEEEGTGDITKFSLDHLPIRHPRPEAPEHNDDSTMSTRSIDSSRSTSTAESATAITTTTLSVVADVPHQNNNNNHHNAWMV